MKRAIYKIKRWFLIRRRQLAMAAMILALLGLAVWLAVATNDAPVPKDFGDSRGSSVALVEDSVAYAQAVKLWQDGDQVAARRTMLRLAPLADPGARTEGYGKAHLWLARQILGGGLGSFLNDFPVLLPENVVRATSGKLAYAGRLPDDPRMIEQALRHLKDAYELSPQLDEALGLLAHLLVATDRRNQAVGLLLDHIAAMETASLNAASLLAHALAYDGDDLLLREDLWLQLTVSGREAAGAKRGDLGLRLRYLLLVFCLDKQDLAEVAMERFEKDFKDLSHGPVLVARMKALRHYLHAAVALSRPPVEPEVVAAAMAKAYDELPGSPALVKAMEKIAVAYPAHREQVVGVLASTPASEIEKLGSEGHAWCLVMAALQPEMGMDHLALAYRLEPSHPEVVTRLLQGGAAAGMSPEELRGLLMQGQRVLGDLHDDAQLLPLELALGEVALGLGDEELALRMLERALAKKRHATSIEIQRVHAALAKVYRQIGQVELAAEHEKRSQ